jgi:L-asparaginase II
MELSLKTPVRIDVPENAFAGDAPLVAVFRGEYVGCLHRGSVAAVDAAGRSHLTIGDADERVFLRSAAKPFQVMPAVLSGGLERFGISDPELAVLCASHSGEPRHTDTVLSVLDRIGLDESSLRCGVHPPIDEATARQRWKAGIDPSPACNNCSGAHAGMLLACRANGWSIENYGSPDHPLQRATREILSVFAALAGEPLEIAVDNCAVPTFRLPLNRAAQAFARLTSGDGLPQQLREAARRVVHAMTSYPEMVGGKQRFDSDLMRLATGSVVAKGGAEGFQALGIIPQQLGIAIKISDGNPRAIPPVALRLLEHFQGLDPPQLLELAEYREPKIVNLLDKPVGRLAVVFDVGGRA